MPQSPLSLARTLEGLHPAPPVEEVCELLFRCSKAEATVRAPDELVVEVTPDRLDLLSEGGLRQHLEGLLGVRSGLPPLPRRDPEGPPPTIEVDPSVSELRPCLGAVRVEAPPGAALDAGLLAEAIRFQEVLHATIGLDRRLASLGIYPASKLAWPCRYALAPVKGLRFHPLDGGEELPLEQFLRTHPLALRYAGYGRAGERALQLLDAHGGLLSLPPILNSRSAGEASIGETSLLLESTGTRAARVEDALGLLELVFVARGWSVSPVRVEFADRADTGESLVNRRRLRLRRATLSAVGGLALPDREVISELGRARLGASPSEEGFTIDAPPWRPDLQGEVDVAEEVLLTRGIRPEERRLPPSFTRGRRLASRALRGVVRSRLLGLGYQPLFSTVLVGEEAVGRLGIDAVALANPVSRELSRLRSTLLVSLLSALERNVRYGYPQRFSEVGPVVLRDASAEGGASTRIRAAFLLAEEKAGFADVAATVDLLLRRLELGGVREPAELPGTIPGRASRLRIAGVVVAEMGELPPSLLDRLGVPVPAAWGEVDLTSLAPLLSSE